ncbi:TlpA family protein disulfide reductase [Janibacter melonis]|uniref:TlpA family protein disulfide reductase n=1 Tax=Janibacter melonis TaxID=262209 RepID=UPI0020448473|nr:TlpA disulfide reductase family protein [Janibacter melonis]MCM3555520.1 TlpA family protein disulfide reductase [Janibacter melonis]
MPASISRRAALSAALGSPVLIAGCAAIRPDENSIEGQAKKAAGSRQNFIPGDGSFRQLSPAERSGPVTLTGRTLNGATWSAADHAGSVVVVNLWVSWCGPCHAEAPDLVRAHDTLATGKDPAEFIGIDFRESSIETGRSQAAAWRLPYDSIFDDGGITAIQMNGVLATQPSTAVLDRTGRVAAVALGKVDQATLEGLTRDVLKERT